MTAHRLPSKMSNIPSIVMRRFRANPPLFSSLVDSVEVQDDKTLVVNLKESYSEFLPMMTIAIIPQSNEDPAGNPIGTGPFKYVSYTPGQNLELEKYDGYWQEGVPSWTAWNLNLLPMWTPHL